jgi:hypothetical protein
VDLDDRPALEPGPDRRVGEPIPVDVTDRKHVLLWRDCALDLLFNGKEWT